MNSTPQACPATHAVASTCDLSKGSSLSSQENSPAPQRTFCRGINICHWLSQCEQPGYANSLFTEHDVAWIAAQGFDHIRYPIDVRFWARADGTLDTEMLKPFEAAIRWTRLHKLGILLDAHFLPGADFNNGGDGRAFVDSQLQNLAVEIWRQIARHFAPEPDDLRFELINEPVAPRNDLLTAFNRRALEAIRESNPTRIVYLTSNKWSVFTSLQDLEVPADPNVAFTMHYYEPLPFTHQNAPWVFAKPGVPQLPFPGDVPDLSPWITPGTQVSEFTRRTFSIEKDIDEAFANLARWAAEKAPNREILIGEFGVYRAADQASTRNWMNAVFAACKRHDFGWTLWGYKSDEFGVVNPDGQIRPLFEIIKEQLNPR